MADKNAAPEFDVRDINIEDVKSEAQSMVASGNLAEAAEFAFAIHSAVVEDYRENRGSDKPSIKKAAEVFEPSEELEELAANVMSQIRALTFEAITENPELSVLLYSQIKDYAQDHVKEYRDAILRGVLGSLSNEEEDDDYVLPLTREELDQVRTMVESFASLADISGQTPDIPRREKSGNIKFANTKGYGEDATATSDAEVTKFTYFLDGEELPATKMADVALWHLSTAQTHVSISDVWAAVREQHGNKSRSEGWKVDVNGRILEAKPVS